MISHKEKGRKEKEGGSASTKKKRKNGKR